LTNLNGIKLNEMVTYRHMMKQALELRSSEDFF